MSENPIELCSNCKYEVPVDNYQMHIIHCKRNIQFCLLCNDRVLRSELEDHNEEFHSTMTCTDCNAKFIRSELSNHKKHVCKKRIIPCQYCDLELKASDIEEHEDYCGSRTECCHECGRHIMLKFQHLHLDSNHKFIKLNDDSSSDSDDTDLMVRTDERYNISPGRKNKKQRHLRQLNGNSANKSTSSKHGSAKQKKSNSHCEDFPELNEYFRNMDLENGRITNSTTTEINEIMSRDRSFRQVTNQQPWLKNDTIIPCEFCKAPISADDLVLHQTGCNFDLSSTSSTADNPYQSYVRNLRREGVREIPTDSDDEEFLSLNQIQGSEDEPVIPCEFCLRHFSLDDISSHQYICHKSNPAV